MKQDELKSAIGRKAAEFIEPNLTRDAIIGVGTGSTANFFIDTLAKSRHKFDGAIASSEATANRLKGHGIVVYDLNDIDEMLYYVDGADESNSNLQLIKGGGGARERAGDDPSDRPRHGIDQSVHIRIGRGFGDRHQQQIGQ